MRQWTHYLRVMLAAIVPLVIVLGQGAGFLSQQLLLETTIQQRVTTAISKILDESQFVVDVKVELDIPGAGTPERAYRLPDGTLMRGAQQPDAASRDRSPFGTTEQAPAPRTNPFPIPGFPAVGATAGGEDVRALSADEAPDGEDVGLEWGGGISGDGALAPSQAEGAGRTWIKSLALSIILEDGVTPQIIENVRQVALIASRFDRDRGDVLSITTAAFKVRRQSASGTAAGQDYDSPQTEELRDELREAEARNKALMQELRDRELEYLQRSEDERKQALADLAEVQNERAKDLIYLQQQREEQNARLQEALLNEISELRQQAMTGGLSTAEQGIKTIQATSLEDSLEAMRANFEQEKSRLQEQIESAMQGTSRSQALGGGGPGLAILVVVIFLAAAIIGAVIYFTSRGRAPMMAMGYPSGTPPGYPRRRPARNRPPRKPRSKKLAAEGGGEEAAAEAQSEAAEPVETAPRPSHVEDDPEVLRSELKSIRQSVVSMSVGRQETASSILSDWLQAEGGSQGAGTLGGDEETGESESTGEEGV